MKQEVTVQPDDHGVTRVKLPDGELRIFEPAADSDDASRMYVLDILGIDVLVRWVDDSTEPDESSFALDVRIDSDCSSIAPHSGVLRVGSAVNVDEWFDVKGDEPEDEPDRAAYDQDIEDHRANERIDEAKEARALGHGHD